jgi:hypothetical protein
LLLDIQSLHYLSLDQHRPCLLVTYCTK